MTSENGKLTWEITQAARRLPVDIIGKCCKLLCTDRNDLFVEPTIEQKLRPVAKSAAAAAAPCCSQWPPVVLVATLRTKQFGRMLHGSLNKLCFQYYLACYRSITVCSSVRSVYMMRSSHDLLGIKKLYTFCIFRRSPYGGVQVPSPTQRSSGNNFSITPCPESINFAGNPYSSRQFANNLEPFTCLIH